MSSSGSIATPLVRGVLAAVMSLATVLALVAVPALAAQVAGSASSATVLDAVIIGLSVLVLGHGGSLLLSTGTIDGAVTLTPLGLMGVLIVISALAMRRVGRALELVREDGVLRTGALRDAGGALGAYAAVYAIGVGVLAAVGRSGDAAPVVTSAVVSGALVAVVGGLAGTLWSVRREATDAVPGVRVLALLPAPFDTVARCIALALAGLFGVGMAVTVAMLLLSFPAQGAIFDQLDPGPVGGAVLTLLQLALLPSLALWALVVVLGGTVTVGTGTGISLAGSETGVLPALPMLAALPQPGTASPWLWCLLLLPLAVLVLGAVRLEREVRELSMRDRVTAWIAYPVGVSVAVLLLAGLSTGGIGDARLVHLGPQMTSVAGPLVLMALAATGAVVGLLSTPLVPWVRASVTRLREKVEGAESRERAERGAAKDEGADDAERGAAGASAGTEGEVSPPPDR